MKSYGQLLVPFLKKKKKTKLKIICLKKQTNKQTEKQLMFSCAGSLLP